MSLVNPAVSFAGVVARLRAAGCVFAEEEAELLLAGARSADELAKLIARRVGGEPLEYVLGWALFCGLRVRVEPGVFVPRRRTEALVREAAGLAGTGSVVVDLCCGTGAVAAALLATLPRAGLDLTAADLDPVAVRCARLNLPGRPVLEGDLFAPLPAALRGRVALLLVNAPYVPTGSIARMPPEAREHEHRLALDGGTDGLDVQRRVAAGAADWLAPGGHLLVETSTRQAPVTSALFARNGLLPRTVHHEDVDGTVVIGFRPRD
jgi:release factor glutamine methyltransferase